MYIDVLISYGKGELCFTEGDGKVFKLFFRPLSMWFQMARWNEEEEILKVRHVDSHPANGNKKRMLN